MINILWFLIKQNRNIIIKVEETVVRLPKLNGDCQYWFVKEKINNDEREIIIKPKNKDLLKSELLNLHFLKANIDKADAKKKEIMVILDIEYKIFK